MTAVTTDSTYPTWAELAGAAGAAGERLNSCARVCAVMLDGGADDMARSCARDAAAATITRAPRRKPTRTTDFMSTRTIASARTEPVIVARVRATCHGFFATPAAANTPLRGPRRVPAPLAD